ncbi:MAG: DUF4854 domain-containing protein [Bacillota bacterium]|nr:DUF4854 domain-containing protein [Bacillota bacterium]
MKKNKRITGIIVAMLLVAMTVLAGCGSQPSTLEEYINSDSEAKETIESMSSEESGLNVTVEDNAIVYTYTYGDTLDSSLLDTVATEIEKTIDSSASTFTTMVDALEEESGIDGITVKVVYLNGDGTEIFSKEY